MNIIKEMGFRVSCRAGFFMLEGMISCALCVVIIFLTAHYFLQSVRLYQKARHRLQALAYAQKSCEQSWAKQAISCEDAMPMYTIVYHHIMTKNMVMHDSLPQRPDAFKQGYFLVTWQDEGTQELRLPFGYIGEAKI